MIASLPGQLRLSSATLSRLRSGVPAPAYDRAALETGIVHLGLGAFARAHLATWLDDVLALSPGNWGIAGVSLRRPDQRDRLAPQDCLYTALERDGASLKTRVIGCVTASLVAAENPGRVVKLMANPCIRMVSLTVTEKGYCHDPAGGRLDANHPDIVHDLDHVAAPRSAVGFIVAALELRRRAGLAPFTVLCCDNLAHNGTLVRGLTLDLAALRGGGLSGWIESNGAFPCSMVDRIVPAATDADVAESAGATGLFDAAPVVHEPFRQWVVQDQFVDAERPAFELAGVEFVADVAPHEAMKLRLLNGAPSALAYLGLLAGHETVAGAVADPLFSRYLRNLWRDEIIPVAPAPAGVNLHAYADTLLRRFENKAIRHRLSQIAMDGSQKLPQRLLWTIRERLARQLPLDGLALAVAAWLRYVGGSDEQGGHIEVRDPLAARLRGKLDEAGPDPARRVAAVLGVESVFGSGLADAPGFTRPLIRAYAMLLEKGARHTIAALPSLRS